MVFKSFLKWAGGKSRLVERITPILPEGKTFIEPFAGSAVIFLNTHYSKNIIADSNSDLINLYQILQKEGQSFIDYAKPFFDPQNNSKTTYMAFREAFNSTTNIRLKSALFIYLNKHGFNGLCRYNLKNQFNVPFGLYHQPPIFPEKEMLFFHEKSRHAVFICDDFRKMFCDANPGDVIYCDPPYAPLSKTANFTGYGANKFGFKEQEELAALAKIAKAKGVKVIISNHCTPYTQKIYADAKISIFDVQRFISAHGSKREKAKELLAEF